MPPFDTVLVANRGEVACRILRSARLLGLGTVAVFSDADRGAPHVRLADRAVHIGAGPARDSYLQIERILDAAQRCGAGAIHPGYGFLSESAPFAEATADAGICFVGPTPDQLRVFGQKHTARAAARSAGVSMLPGSDLLGDVDEAIAEADRIGWPVMLKATSGGGGIGMQACRNHAELTEAFESVGRLAQASFGAGGVYLEALVDRARHIEVQLFGDGFGRVLTLGDRDCSLQRRNQKVIEEAPAPALTESTRAALHHGAVTLGASVGYRSAGTVEYVYDAEREAAYFLEVNTRLQVEHGVTEAVFGIDLVAWMLRLELGDVSFFDEDHHQHGCAVEARIYAEDPSEGYRPSAGILTGVVFPSEVRIDTWVEPGTEVTSYYDPLLAKVIARADGRNEAIARLGLALEATRLDGIETNIGILSAALGDEDFCFARHTTATLAGVIDDRPRIEVAAAGPFTTVQDWPGRQGYWHVGVPPSGPMDDRSFQLGNRALGNPPGSPGLEVVLSGPTLRFTKTITVCVTGAPTRVTLNDEPQAMWTPFAVPAGAFLEIGPLEGPGLRAYLLVEGGFTVADHLGSASTFTLGGFGGHGGRALRNGDVLRPGPVPARDGTTPNVVASAVPNDLRPNISSTWEIGVLEGPHAAPEFFTPDDIETFYATAWGVHFNSARTGVRLIGPQPTWARSDGGEAGLHPSNIHDTPYAVATVDFTGDTPILLGPDGPSLGGFVCPATVVVGERWKLGQLRPGDIVRFVPITEEDAAARREVVGERDQSARAKSATLVSERDRDGGVLRRDRSGNGHPEVTYRRQGDDHLLVEYGPMALDLGMRLRIHSLAERLEAGRHRGIIDITPGIRSLQLHLDPDRLTVRQALGLAVEIEADLPPTRDLSVASRTIHLPLSWDDPAAREATERYMAGVRDDAPWCPWNIEFIRRVNGLGDVAEVERIVHAAEYMVLGLGDVYLGAPVATPLDPRHRLVTTKYNPARTWTPENAVGIGGAYLCIYGMEGPGGYQFIGRTVQVWSRWHERGPFEKDVPWLLRYFDRIRWYPVGPDELLELRADMAAGRLDVQIDPGTFAIAEHDAFLEEHAASIEHFGDHQRSAFAEERERWRESGEFDRVSALERRSTEPSAPVPPIRSDGVVVTAPMAASVWRIEVQPGQTVEPGTVLCTLEAMKLEVKVTAPIHAVVDQILAGIGEQVPEGHPLVVIVGTPRQEMQ